MSAPPGMFMGKSPSTALDRNRRIAKIRRVHRRRLEGRSRKREAEYAGNPDYEIDQLPGSLTGER